MSCADRRDIPDSMADPWFVYVLSSERGRRTYVGITTDPPRRLAQHNGELRGGARTTRAGRPWRIAACYGPFDGRGPALRVERAVKRLRGRTRLHWRPAARAAGSEAPAGGQGVDSKGFS